MERLAELEVPTPPQPPLHGRGQAAAFAAAISEYVTRYVAQSKRGPVALPLLVLRALERARYAAENLGHSGLASPAYCHFTSPIRRYPDLVVHRALLALIGAAEPVVLERRELDHVAASSSASERQAARIERRGDNVCLAFLLQDVLYERGWSEPFRGEVVGMIEGALFVRFGEVFGGAAARSAAGAGAVRARPAGRLDGRPLERTPLPARRSDRCLGAVDRARPGAGAARPRRAGRPVRHTTAMVSARGTHGRRPRGRPRAGRPSPRWWWLRPLSPAERPTALRGGDGPAGAGHNGPDPRAVVRRFAAAWSAGDYHTMYRQLTARTRPAGGYAAFARAYRAAASVATLSSVSFKGGERASAGVGFAPLALHTHVFGVIEANLALPVVRVAGGYRVAWAPQLVWPADGVRASGAPRRRTDHSRRDPGP